METGISISFDDPPNSKFYRSGSIVKGTVKLNHSGSPRLSIKLRCDSSVRRKDFHQIWHRLLDLDMQIEKSTSPPLDYWNHTVPFSFVLPGSHEGCSHDVDSTQIQKLHSCLPPTISHLDKEARRAMFPAGVEIEYIIVAEVWSYGRTRMEIGRPFNVLPALVEHSLLIPNMVDDTKMTATQQLKSKFFTGNSGHINLSVNPPTTLVLPVGSGSLPPIDITGFFCLEFSKGKPALPQSCIFSAKFESQTWSQTAPMQELPDIQEVKNCHSVSEVLERNAEMNLVWERNASEETNTVASSSVQNFTAQIKALIPAFSSSERVFPPTFYSCLIARTYRLHITIIIASVPLRLVLPLQLYIKNEGSSGKC
ncbi:unnamed protein product [Fusarium venenatum]|uniref:Arrestin-like N-terminal domain-containing protein n=2 Tax=Fusarium venenatum TaxID=56646 RepID=A0A2L2T1R4_9HYPO|nr:uncharacterized protein FVRRES_12674 [Fusarium venenatum]CEI39983.1 unnamed protein product [Fusarium venenatum]